MAEEDDRPTRGSGDGHPVLTGLLALVAVAVTVGLILGGGALAATKVLGIGGDEQASDSSSDGESMYLPPPEPTQSDSGPQVTLDADPQGSPPPTDETSEAEPETKIALSSDQTQVSSMERIYLTGTYPGGEGAILQVQQWEGGAWGEFPVTASVSNETFTTYIQTSQTGRNRFRVIDTDTGEASNEVRVRIG